MAFLKFLKGDYAKLNTTAVAEGQILICNDTAEMFVDIAADKRIKIGDFTVVATIEALEALDATAVPTSRLYYVEDGNILARSNGTTWIQINKQRTKEETVALLGLGSAAYTDATAYDKAGAADAVRAYVGEIPDGYTEETIIAYINKKAEETLSSASGGSTESAASVLAALNTYKSENDPKVQANTEAIEAIEADYLKAADKTELSDAIAAEKTRAEGVETGLRTDVDAIKADYLKAADKEALQTQITENANAITLLTDGVDPEKVDGVKDLITYVDEHGAEVTGMQDDIAANAKAIADQATENAKTYETKTDATAKLTEAKEYADGLNTAMDTRVDALEAINHNAYIAADEAVLTEAKAYTDELANGAVATNTANVADMMNMLTWGEFN